MDSNTVRVDDTTDIYTIKDLQRKLEKSRGRRVPIDTLKRWRHRLGITPIGRLYTRQDYECLKGLMHWIDNGGNTTQFVNLLKQRMQKYGS